jgi:hypothetical protein
VVRLASLRAADALRERQLLQFFLGDLGQVRVALPFRRRFCTLRIVASILATVLEKGKPAVRLRRKATGRTKKSAGVPPK